MKIKKPILLIIITLLMFCSTGCGLKINISTLGTYLKVKDPANNQYDATPMQAMLDTTVTRGLSKMKDAYAALNIDITPTNANVSVPLTDYIDIMESWYYSLTSKPEIGSLAEGKTKTSYGTVVAESCYLDKDYKSKLLDASSQSIAATLIRFISMSNVGLEATNIPTAVLSSDDIDTALTMIGYDLDKCEMVVLYSTSTDSENESRKALNDMGQTNFLIRQNGPDETTNCGLMQRHLSGTSWTGGMFGRGGLSGAGRKVYNLDASMELATNNTKRQHKIIYGNLSNTTTVKPRGVSVDFSITSNGLPDIPGIRELLDNNTKWTDSDFGSSYRNQAYHITKNTAVDVFGSYSNSYNNYDSRHLSIDYMPKYRGVGTSTEDTGETTLVTNQSIDYWIPIGYFKHIESSADNNYLTITGGTDFVIGVHLKYAFHSDDKHFDIGSLISIGNETSVKPFSPVPPADKIGEICKKVGDNDVLAFTKYSNTTLPTLDDMLKKIYSVSKARVVILKDKLSSARIPKAPEILSLGAGSDFEVLKSGNDEVYVNLLTGLNTANTAVEDKHYKLCVGNVDIGGIKVQKLDDNITCSTNSLICDQNGTTVSSSTQTYKYYIQDGETYLLFGFYDIGVARTFKATPTEKANDTDYNYKYVAQNSGLSYNIFDEQIYSYGTASTNYTPVKFSNTGGAQLPLGQVRTDISVITGDDCSHTTNSTSSNYINKDLTSTMIKKSEKIQSIISIKKSPLMLNTYLEALYLPGIYNDENFVCLGRKVKLGNCWFDGTPINGSTNAFSIINPDTSTSTEITHKATELISAKLETITVGETYKYGEPQGDGIIYEGIARLRQKNAENIYRSGELGKTLATVNQLFVDEIYTGEFKTVAKQAYWRNAVFAKDEAGNRDIPSMFVICTATNVDSSLLAYLKDETGTFRQWTRWLHSNGYPHYLPDDTDFNKLIQTIVTKIETTYDITLSDDKNSAGVHIDREKIDKLEQWVDRITEEKKNSIFKVLIRIIGIIIFLYSVAIIFCYVVDVAVAGEGQGLLYVITCHRMRSVSGVSRKERAQMSTQSEHGTYTVRAVSFIDLIPALFIFFTLGILLMTGLYAGAIAKLTDIANQVTSVFRDAIGK